MSDSDSDSESDSGSHSDSDSGSDSPPAYSDDDANATDVSSSRASAHEDAQQCGFCRKWFNNDWQYNEHVKENNSGCSQHEECFPNSDNFRHARESYHRRCFVPGCKSLYREDSDNDDEDIMDHVWSEHTDRG